MRCWWVAVFVFIVCWREQWGVAITLFHAKGAVNSVTVRSSRMGDVEDFPDFREASSPGPRVTFNIQDTVNKKKKKMALMTCRSNRDESFASTNLTIMICSSQIQF